MRHKHAVIFIAVNISLALLALAILSRAPQTPAAHAAAPKNLQFVYLPIVVKSTGCGSGSLIRDGGFEASTSGTTNPYWQVATNLPRSIFDNSGIPTPQPTHSGAWKAWLGGDNLLTQTLTQTLAVPAGANSLQISYWWLVNTSEPNPQGFDFVDVQIRNNAGVVQETPHHIFDIDAGTVWAQTIVTASQSYANQTIQLAFAATTDTTNPTSFFIDDVSVVCQ